MVDPCWWLNMHGFKYSYTYPFFEFVSWLFGRVPTQQMGGARTLLLPICKGVRLLLASLRFFWRVRPLSFAKKEPSLAHPSCTLWPVCSLPSRNTHYSTSQEYRVTSRCHSFNNALGFLFIITLHREIFASCM